MQPSAGVLPVERLESLQPRTVSGGVTVGLRDTGQAVIMTYILSVKSAQFALNFPVLSIN